MQAHRAADDDQLRPQLRRHGGQPGQVDVHPLGVVGQLVHLEAVQARGALGVVRRVPGGGVGEGQDAVARTRRGHVDVEVRQRAGGDPQLGVPTSVEAADRLLGEQLELRARVHAAVVLRARVAEVRPAPDRRSGDTGEPRVGRVRAGVEHEAVLVGVPRLLGDEPVQLGVELIRGEGGEPRGVFLRNARASAPSHGCSVTPPRRRCRSCRRCRCCSPRSSHDARSSALPWVKLSGLTVRPASRISTSSPTDAAAFSPSSRSPFSISPRCLALLPQTPARQSACSSTATDELESR